jgi:uncharacterized protein YggE
MMLQIFGRKARVAVCTAVALLAFTAAARADVTVSGTGKVTVRPDIAYIALGVVTDGNTASEALPANSAAMRKLFDLIARLGIAERDVETTDFSVSPKYSHPKDAEPVLVGYTVTNQVRVKVRKLDDAGTVLDALVKEGANRVSAVTFSVADPEKALDEARARAMADALQKAEIYAQGGKVSLGPVKSIAEQNVATPQWRYAPEAFMAGKAGGVPLAQGEHELSVSVTVVYALGARQ